MTEKLKRKDDGEYAILKKMNIYELRKYGRKKGIARVTAQKKDELIQSILKIGSETEPIQKATIQFTISELKTLAELVYMGFYVANGYRKEYSKEQFAVSSVVYREYSALKNKITDKEDIEENEIADVRDELCSETEEYVTQFENDILSEKGKL